MYNVHSHEFNLSFSGYGADLTTTFCGFGKGEDFFVPKLVQVAAPEFNYALVKSKVTPIVIDHRPVYEAMSHNYSFKEFAELRRYGSTWGGQLSNDEFWQVFETAQQRYFKGYFGYFYQSITYSLAVAEAYDAGFYFSKKDGIYHRFNRGLAIEFIKQRLDEALRSSLDVLG